MDIIPYGQGFIEFNTNGRTLKGHFEQLGFTSKAEYEKLHEMHYGIELGAHITAKQARNVNLSLSYDMDHYGEDVHSMNVAVSYDM